MRFFEKLKFAFVAESANVGSAGFTGDSINSGLVNSCQWLVLFGNITGNSLLTVKSGASAGAETTAETFWYKNASGDANAASGDLFPAGWTSSSSLTLTATTYDHRMLLVFVDHNIITAGQPYLTLSIDATATTMNVACAFIGEAKFVQATGGPTIL